MSPARERQVWPALFAFLLLAACGDGRVAGGYDDVENPAIRVSLADAEGKPYGAAVLSLYARYQNPFNDSLPLVSLASSGESITLPDSTVRSAFARARARGTRSPSPDTLEFNLIAEAPGGEAYEGGFALIRRISGWSFIRRSGAIVSYADANGVLVTSARLLAPVLGQRGQIGLKGLELGLKRIFVPGTPYVASLEADSAFTFTHIAAGSYELKAIAADDKVYTAADSLTTGTSYSASDWSEAEVIWIAP